MILAFVLLLVGLGLILAEVFFPSLGMLGLLAGAAILGADVLAFREGGNVVGWLFIAAEVVGIPLLVRAGFRWLPHLPFGRRMILAAPTTPPGAGTPDLAGLVGARGVADSDLRPSGTARFGERRVSVVAVAGMVPRGSAILVLAVDGPEIRVDRDPSAPGIATPPPTETVP
jgi:membrane-bound serine protease (ClpP class)